VVLLLLLIFILENRREADIAYFGAHAHMPLGLALLLAAAVWAWRRSSENKPYVPGGTKEPPA